jgi:hypothetical protein
MQARRPCPGDRLEASHLAGRLDAPLVRHLADGAGKRMLREAGEGPSDLLQTFFLSTEALERFEGKYSGRQSSRLVQSNDVDIGKGLHRGSPAE